MNATKVDATIRIELSEDEAATLAAHLQAATGRSAAMCELYERLVGSPAWKRARTPARAHVGVVSETTFARVIETCT